MGTGGWWLNLACRESEIKVVKIFEMAAAGLGSAITRLRRPASIPPRCPLRPMTTRLTTREATRFPCATRAIAELASS